MDEDHRWLADRFEDGQKAVAQAFVPSLTVEARDRILPKFEIRRAPWDK
jgi:hypothetical protein